MRTAAGTADRREHETTPSVTPGRMKSRLARSARPPAHAPNNRSRHLRASKVGERAMIACVWARRDRGARKAVRRRTARRTRAQQVDCAPRNGIPDRRQRSPGLRRASDVRTPVSTCRPAAASSRATDRALRRDHASRRGRAAIARRVRTAQAAPMARRGRPKPVRRIDVSVTRGRLGHRAVKTRL